MPFALMTFKSVFPGASHRDDTCQQLYFDVTGTAPSVNPDLKFVSRLSEMVGDKTANLQHPININMQDVLREIQSNGNGEYVLVFAQSGASGPSWIPMSHQ